MSAAGVLALLGFLDEFFNLGGKLVEAAIQKHPELRTDPLPGVEDLDQARDDARKRTSPQ